MPDATPLPVMSVGFAFGSISPDANADKNIINWGNVIRTRPTQIFLLVGHTDARGDEAANVILGWRRALAVRDRLLAYGVAPRQLRVASSGEMQPEGDNSTSSGRAKNGRVSITATEEYLPDEPA